MLSTICDMPIKFSPATYEDPASAVPLAEADAREADAEAATFPEGSAVGFIDADKDALADRDAEDDEYEDENELVEGAGEEE